MSEHYLKRVSVEACRLIEQHAAELPDEQLQVETDWAGKHTTRIVVKIHSNTTGHWVCDDPLTEIVNELNSRFQNDRHFAGIEIEIDADWADGFGNNFELIGIGARLRVKRSDHG
jgi:hypothetical protein